MRRVDPYPCSYPRRIEGVRRARSSSRPGAGPAVDGAALPGADRDAPPGADRDAPPGADRAALPGADRDAPPGADRAALPGAGEVARRAGTHRGDGGRR
ncbi:hypothetical protein [Sorangium sp. So ce1151]|uniref:hypothetical protein n=1 Tax=Sorangium sp. So ce1151 TaxID=3133332 RepID=UPI003F60B143